MNTGNGVLGHFGPGIIGPHREQKGQVGQVGSTVELRCGIGGRQYNWRKEDDEEELPRTAILLGPTLTLLNLQENDSGRYNQHFVFNHKIT